MWDPKSRPTSSDSLRHEYFADAYDPLRPKSASSKLLGRKHVEGHPNGATQLDAQSLSSKTSSWFSAPAVPQIPVNNVAARPPSPQPSPIKHEVPAPQVTNEKTRPQPNKRSTWTHGSYASGAPMPILPSIRPVSPLSNTVTAQAHPGAEQSQQASQPPPKKIGRQLSVASQGSHYPDTHRQEAERALNGNGGLTSPSGTQKESFFSHLRKRARRLSVRTQLPTSPKDDEMDKSTGCAPWGSQRNSMTDNEQCDAQPNQNFTDLDKALQNVRYSLESSANQPGKAAVPVQPAAAKTAQRVSSNPVLKRHPSLSQAQGRGTPSPTPSLSQSRSLRRGNQKPNLSANQYETPDEQEELLDEALSSAQFAAAHLDRQQQNQGTYRAGARQPDYSLPVPYPTPSPSAKRNSVLFGNSGDQQTPSKPIDIAHGKNQAQASAYPWPTPPYDDNEWAAAAAASIAAAGDQYR